VHARWDRIGSFRFPFLISSVCSVYSVVPSLFVLRSSFRVFREFRGSCFGVFPAFVVLDHVEPRSRRTTPIEDSGRATRIRRASHPCAFASARIGQSLGWYFLLGGLWIGTKIEGQEKQGTYVPRSPGKKSKLRAARRAGLVPERMGFDDFRNESCGTRKSEVPESSGQCLCKA